MRIKKFMPTILTLLGISFIIFFHELGHFSMCKLFNVPTPVFSIGFGPALVQYKTQNTTFQIALLPLGGYVSIDSNVLMQRPYWQQLIICLAGIINNLLLASILILFIFTRNRSRLVPSNCQHENPPEQPAPKSDLSPIDQPNSHPTMQQKDVSFKESLKEALAVIAQIFKTAGGLLPAKTEKKAEFIGPRGIIAISKESLEKGWYPFFLWMAFISAQVAFFNLLPLPFLDGGQVVQLTGQAIAGRSLNPSERMILQYIAIALVIAILFMASKRKK